MASKGRPVRIRQKMLHAEKVKKAGKFKALAENAKIPLVNEEADAYCVVTVPNRHGSIPMLVAPQWAMLESDRRKFVRARRSSTDAGSLPETPDLADARARATREVVRALAKLAKLGVQVEYRTAEAIAEKPALVVRLEHAVQRLVRRAPPEVRAQAEYDESAMDALARLISTLSDAPPTEQLVSPLAAALARGAQYKREVLDATPTSSIGEIAELLGVTAAAIQKRIKKGTLLALPVQREYRIPLFQIDASSHDVDARLRPLLDAAAENGIDGWSLWSLLMTPVRGVEPPQTVVDLARAGRAEDARRIVAGFGSHGA